MSRATEQELPDTNDQEYCQDTLSSRVIDALEESKQIGEAKYGTALQPFNKRDVQRDMFEEWLDLGVYLEQNRRERIIVVDLLCESYDAAVKVQNLGLARRILTALNGMGVDK